MVRTNQCLSLPKGWVRFLSIWFQVLIFWHYREQGNEKRHQKDVAAKVYSVENTTGKSNLRQIDCKEREGLDEDVLSLKGIKLSYRCV